MNRLHINLLCLSITIISLALFSYKAFVLKFPLVPDTERAAWNVEVQVTFNTWKKPTKVKVYIPHNTDRFAIMDENFISGGFGLTTSMEDNNRQAVWAVRQASGQQRLFYRAIVRPAELETSTKGKAPEIIDPKFEGSELAAVDGLLNEIRAKSADTESLVTELLERLSAVPAEDNVAILLGKNASALKQVELAARILSHIKIGSRVVHGVRLYEIRDAPLVHWIEVFDEGKWNSFNPATATKGIPDDYMELWHGTELIAQIKGGEKLRTGLSVSRFQEEAVNSAITSGRIRHPYLVNLSLFNLPIQTQMVYRMILMIPVGAFIVVLLRTVIGLKTFGTFMPVLIALAFRETQLLWGISFFVIIIGIGLMIRFYFEHLKLLLVPRLAAVLTVVVFMMAIISAVSHRLGIEHGLSVALFPMVILTMTIERMSIVWDELGAVDALKQGLGSILGAAITYLFMTWPTLEHLLFVFPELLLILLALNLLLGRYTGYRLLEIYRFKSLVQSKT